MNAYELSPEARKIIARFSRDEFYVYIRPTTSRYAEPSKKEGQWWVVSVQIRALPPQEFREEGRSLDEAIRRLGRVVPRRKDLPNWRPVENVKTDHIGFLAPEKLWNKKYESILSDRKASNLAKSAVRLAKKSRKEGTPFENLGEIPPPSKNKKKKKGKK